MGNVFLFNLTLVLQYKEVLGKGAFKKVYPFILFAMLTLNLYYERKKKSAASCTMVNMILGPELLYLGVLDRNVGISDIEHLMNWKELK